MSLKFIHFIFIVFLALKGYTLGQVHTEVLKHNGLNRSYEVFLPKMISPLKEYPVIFVLHGGGGTGKGLMRHTKGRFNRLAEKNEFVVVYPNGIKKSWNDGRFDTISFSGKMNIDDVGFIEEILAHLDSKFYVDAEKVFACGISNGGFMVQRLAFEIPDKIKGIAVVAANLGEAQAKKMPPQKPVPALFINGTHDPLVPYYGGYVTVFRQKRGSVLSMEKTIEKWNEINGCETLAEVKVIPDKDKNDGCRAIKTTWKNPDNAFAKVVAIKVEEGGHTWPGATRNLPRRLVGNSCNDFNACDEIVSFFQLTGKMKW